MSDGAPVDNAALVDRGDLDELTRQVDRLVAGRHWDGLVDLHDRCRRALERGRQLWPVAAHAAYRLALEAPGPWAARVVDTTTARFTLGPLPEVAASTHTWAELAASLPTGPAAAVTLHERVVRGDDLRSDPVAAAMPPVFELPLVLEPWEPVYAVAEYHPDKADFAAPPTNVELVPVDVPTHRAPTVDDHDACRALCDLARAWTTESNGRAEAVAVRGEAVDAVASLGVRHARMGTLDAAGAFALMAWTAASGGAHGRRPGAAAGRYGAWWALVALAGALDDWPLPPDEVGDLAAELRWHAWDAGEPATGWSLHLAVEDPAEGLAWALAATDSV